MSSFKYLFKLPAELRTRIYELHFKGERGGRVVNVPETSWEISPYESGPWYNKQPPITRASRQFRSESLPVFYSICTFRLQSLCAPCIPDDLDRQYLSAGQKSNRLRGEDCRCFADDGACSSEDGCRSRWLKRNPWHWLAGIGRDNLTHLRTLSIKHYGNMTVGHVGYGVVVCQCPTTKRLRISEDSYWQDDFDPLVPARKVHGSDPDGRAIIDEIHQALDQDKPEGMDSHEPGLTIARIYTVLDISYKRSFVQRRDPSRYSSSLGDLRRAQYEASVIQ